MNTMYFDIPDTLALGQIGWTQMIVLGLLGVLIFGKRLPEVGKSLGKGIVEFKKGLSGIDTDIEDAAHSGPSKQLDASSTAPPAQNAAETSTATASQEPKAD